MANGLLQNYSGMDALGAMGLGLLNASQGKQVDPIKALNLWNAYRTQQNVQPQQSQISGINPGYIAPQSPIDDSVSRLMNSIGRLESSNDYSTVGPRTSSGDRAYGKYQVMGANIPSWTKEVLGYELTPEQFLQSNDAQDAVARAKLGGYLQKYGNINDAASMWFSGRPYRNNVARDVLGTSVPQYVATVNRYYGG